MSLRIRFQATSGTSYGFSIERLADGWIYDFSAAAFAASPTAVVQALAENTPTFPGQYRYNLSPTPQSRFPDGDYAVTIVDLGASLVAAQLAVVMHNGDDATQIPGGPVQSVTSPVTVGVNNDKSGYALTQAFPANFSTLVVDSSGRVGVGSVADKTGYALAASGLDAVPVEQGINARQALAPILAASAGVVTGAGTGSIIIRGANVSTSRITATTDNSGNRTSVTLSIPA